ncbi:hypothetical protein [Variovorax ginsengisoli]|uniref:PAS domain-containing protein n=1 Tax=Variovorax ginsengisoli TaxID=363844 RepID=A0ABT9S6N5_9BURK|nr:hypothetical protein [Variovorax ginsengisoli]MDP9900028.1 hypothetical protein [Variovorax ginsengisoli]
MTERAGALLALWNDVTPALDATYNAWHAQEHVPERCTVPGILWGRRFGQTQSGAMPRYLTLYGLRDAAVLDSAAYQRLLSEPTPASRAMRPELCNLSRWVCRLDAEGDTAHGSHLLVATFVSQTDADAALGKLPVSAISSALRGLRLHDASPLPWLRSGQDKAVEGEVLLCLPVSAQDSEEAARRLGDVVVYARLPVGGG